jgi:hypothetical protein
LGFLLRDGRRRSTPSHIVVGYTSLHRRNAHPAVMR